MSINEWLLLGCVGTKGIYENLILCIIIKRDAFRKLKLNLLPDCTMLHYIYAVHIFFIIYSSLWYSIGSGIYVSDLSNRLTKYSFNICLLML